MKALYLLLAASCLLWPAYVRAKPGQEHLLERKELLVRLYLGAVHRTGDRDIDLVLVWIPEDIRERCLGKALTYCEQLDNCIIYPDAQNCAPDLSSCSPAIRDECTPFGFTLDNIRDRPQRKAPMRILRTTLRQKVGDQSFPFSLDDLSGDVHAIKELERLDDRYSIQAEIVWERWTNGESFKVSQLRR